MRSLLIVLIVAATVSPAVSQDRKPTEAEVVTYKDQIAPILRKHCGSCHNADEAKSDLNLMTYSTLMAGGSSGEAIAPGSADQSLLYRLVTHQEEPAMPLRQPKLADSDLALIAKWIERGAPETAVSAAKISARTTDMDLSATTTDKPSGSAAMPESLAPYEVPATLRPAAVTALDASPWAPLLAVSGHECIQLYNTDSYEPVGAIAFPDGVVHVLKFSRNGEVLLAAGGRGAEQGRVVLFDVRTGKRLAEIGDEYDSVLAADISNDQTLVALGGPDKLVKVFSTQTGKQLYEIKKHTDWITALEFSPDGNYLASGDRNGGAFVWESTSGGIVYTLGDHKEMITQTSWRADSQLLATSSEDGRVILWYAEDGFPARSINAHAASNNGRPNPRQKLPGVMSVRFARGGDFATAGRDLAVKVWGNGGAQNLAKFEDLKQLPSRVCLTHDGSQVIAGDLGGTIRAWDVKNKMLLKEFSTQAE
ncbi:MAG: c-type cytochrome domain-containing protein [Planctomycetaceae bacterium]